MGAKVRFAWVIAAFFAGLPVPAIAWDDMSLSECRMSLSQLFEYLPADDIDWNVIDAALSVSADRWCSIAGDAVTPEPGEFGVVEWRMEDAARWTEDGIAPIALGFRMTDVLPDDRADLTFAPEDRLTIEIDLRQDQDAGVVTIERAAMANGRGDVVSVSGVFGRVFLTSPAMMQMSAGSAVFQAGFLSMTLTGEMENPFGFPVEGELRGSDEAQRQAAFDLLSRLPMGVLDASSRAELTAFAGDLPEPVGTLEASIFAERGLGLMQVGAAAAMQLTQDEAERRQQMAVLLDGVTIRADWTPTAQVAD